MVDYYSEVVSWGRVDKLIYLNFLPLLLNIDRPYARLSTLFSSFSCGRLVLVDSSPRSFSTIVRASHTFGGMADVQRRQV